MFDTLTTDATIKTSGDSLGGSKFSLLESDLYDFTIKLAYGSIAQNGAKTLNLLLETEGGKEYKPTLWLTSDASKGCLNYYMAKNPTTGEYNVKTYNKDFEAANQICLMCLNKNLSEVATEEKTIRVYDFAQRKEIPTAVKMATELIGKKITVGVIKRLGHKYTKDATSNEWVATPEIKEKNVFDKVFHYPTGLTITEAEAKMTEPNFIEQWRAKWSGVLDDRTDPSIIANAGKNTNTTNATPSAPREGASLFGGAAAA